MIEQQAKVIKFDKQTVWLETERQSTCGQCQIRRGCGTALLEKHVGQRFSNINVMKTSDVIVGQNVQIEIPEVALLRGAFFMYIVPLLMLFLFATIAQLITANDGLEILAGFVGLIVGFYGVRYYFSGNNHGIRATIVKD